ncbi:MAG: ribonuclease P protein component [Clostridia bacterium]|nr:ribonuclease P protein component [Clostridia bacterium]
MTYLRIKKYEQFRKLFKSGKRAYSSSVTLIFRPSKRMEMGIAISKKYGHAVVRNRIKRLLREAFRATQGELKSNYSVIIIPKVADDYSLGKFKKGLLQCFKKVNS